MAAGSLSTAAAATAYAAGEAEAAPVAIVRPRVMVTVNGPTADAQALSDSLQELLRRLGLELQLTAVDQFAPAEPWRAVPAEVVVRAWIDLRQPDAALITLSDRRSGRTGPARLVPRRGSRDLLLEETALVVHAETESLLSGPVEVAAAPDAPPNSTGAEPNRQRTRSHQAAQSRPIPWTIDALTFAEARSFAVDTGAVFGAGAGGRVHFGRSAWYPGLWLIGAYHVPFGQTELPVQLNARVWSLRLLPTLRTPGRHSFALEFGVGGGVDWFAISPGATVGVSQLDANRSELSPIVESLLALHVAISPSARLVLATTLDWDLTPRRYVAANATTRDVLIQVHGFRPGLTLGLSFEIAHSAEAR